MNLAVAIAVPIIAPFGIVIRSSLLPSYPGTLYSLTRGPKTLDRSSG